MTIDFDGQPVLGGTSKASVSKNGQMRKKLLAKFATIFLQ
jgi:hypothetical protein